MRLPLLACSRNKRMPAWPTLPNSTKPLDSSAVVLGFSTRKLKTGQTLCMKVRNSAGTLLDVGFEANGWVDRTALWNHAAGGDVTVHTLYDPRGTSMDAVQATVANQALIVKAGVIQTLNNRPWLNADGKDVWYHVTGGSSLSIGQNKNVLRIHALAKGYAGMTSGLAIGGAALVTLGSRYGTYGTQRTGMAAKWTGSTENMFAMRSQDTGDGVVSWSDPTESHTFNAAIWCVDSYFLNSLRNTYLIYGSTEVNSGYGGANYPSPNYATTYLAVMGDDQHPWRGWFGETFIDNALDASFVSDMTSQWGL